jgi:hypothetical protein
MCLFVSRSLDLGCDMYVGYVSMVICGPELKSAENWLQAVRSTQNSTRLIAYISKLPEVQRRTSCHMNQHDPRAGGWAHGRRGSSDLMPWNLSLFVHYFACIENVLQRNWTYTRGSPQSPYANNRLQFPTVSLPLPSTSLPFHCSLSPYILTLL